MTYMPPVYPDPSPPQTPRGTSGTAIAGFVLAWLAPAVGLIVSLVALSSTGRGRRGGRGLAIAGATLGGVFSTFWMLLIVGLVAGGGSSDDTTMAVEAIEPQVMVAEEAPVVAEPQPLPPVEPAPPASPETVTTETWRQLVVDPGAWSGRTIQFQADVLQYDTATGPETLLAFAGPSGLDVWEMTDTVVVTR